MPAPIITNFGLTLGVISKMTSSPEEINSHTKSVSIGFELTPRQIHDKIWDAIFPRNKRWLFIAVSMGLLPTLVSHTLINFYQGHRTPTYIVLSTGDFFGDLINQKELLFECLEAYSNGKRRFNADTKEVVLEEFNITLNIEDAYLSPESIRIDTLPATVLGGLFWQDYNLRVIGPDSVVGIGGRASNLESVASVLIIELTHPKMTVIGGKRWNQSFQNPGLPLNAKPTGETVRFIVGWKMVD